MPTFELLLLLRKIPEPELKSAMKRAAQYILHTGAVLRNMEYLGSRQCPYKIKSPHGLFTEANYFSYKFDGTRDKAQSVRDKLRLDVDTVRYRIYYLGSILDVRRKQEEECTLHVDMLDVPFRPHVQELVRLTEGASKTKKFNYGSDRDHDPLCL